MKANSGNHFIGLDHIRALAAFMVFTWHFTRGNLFNGVWESIPIPAYPLSIFTQGHTGVALFMTLSGYLFAKLLDNKRIRYFPFLWTRFVRLAPLLILVILIVGYQTYSNGGNMSRYIEEIQYGLIKPSFPNGGWSITAELHFYILLPLILFLDKRYKTALCIVLIVSVAAKFMLYQELDQIRTLSYNTIVGRIDQFILGIAAFKYRHHVSGRHIQVLVVLAAFLAFYSFFDATGGFNNTQSSIWVYLPLIEGVAYGLFISWYDNSFQHSKGRLSLFIAHIGKCSYSIYLLHFFFVYKFFSFTQEYINPLSNIYENIIFSLVCFLCMVPIAHLSYRFIEVPFFRYKANYIKN